MLTTTPFFNTSFFWICLLPYVVEELCKLAFVKPCMYIGSCNILAQLSHGPLLDIQKFNCGMVHFPT